MIVISMIVKLIMLILIRQCYDYVNTNIQSHWSGRSLELLLIFVSFRMKYQREHQTVVLRDSN